MDKIATVQDIINLMVDNGYSAPEFPAEYTNIRCVPYTVITHLQDYRITANVESGYDPDRLVPLSKIEVTSGEGLFNLRVIYENRTPLANKSYHADVVNTADDTIKWWEGSCPVHIVSKTSEGIYYAQESVLNPELNDSCYTSETTDSEWKNDQGKGLYSGNEDDYTCDDYRICVDNSASNNYSYYLYSGDELIAYKTDNSNYPSWGAGYISREKLSANSEYFYDLFGKLSPSVEYTLRVVKDGGLLSESPEYFGYRTWLPD